MQNITILKSNYKLKEKACLKRWVFSRRLNSGTEVLLLISRGSLFQRPGAHTEKALEPYDFSLYAGCSNNNWSDDLSARLG